MRLLNVIFILLLLNPCFSQQEKSSLVPPELLFKQINQYNYIISPDGKYFAEILENNIDCEILVVDIKSMTLLYRIELGKKSIENLYWLNPKRLLYESLGEIFAIDIDGSNSTLIVDRLPDMQAKSLNDLIKSFRLNTLLSLYPKNKNEILIEAYDYKGFSTVKRVNIFTGEQTTLISGKSKKINKWIVDSSGSIRFGIRIENQNFEYLIYNEETDRLEEFFVMIDGNMVSLNYNGQSFLNLEVSFEGFDFNNDIIYLTSNYKIDKRKLLAYSLSEKMIIDTLLEDVNCDVKGPIEDDSYLIFDYKNSKLAGVKYESIVPKFKWFSSDFSIVHDELNKKFPNMINEIIDSDLNNSNFLISQWNDHYAGNIGVYNTIDKTYSTILLKNEELNNYVLSKTKNVIATVRDNYKVPCYLNIPEDKNNEKKPLVVIPHGGPWARDYWKLDSFAQYFASRGYYTLRVNFRGSIGFGKAHMLSGIHSMDEIMINDIVDATKFIFEQYPIDINKVFIFGHSYGGYATYMSLIKYPEIYKSGVALSAPSDIKQWMKNQKKENNYFAYEFWRTALGSNKSKYLDQISSINYAKNIKNPILIFHGKKDQTIPVSHSEEMIKILKKTNVNAKLEILKNEGHSISDSNSMGYILESAKDFFDSSISN